MFVKSEKCQTLKKNAGVKCFEETAGHLSAIGTDNNIASIDI